MRQREEIPIKEAYQIIDSSRHPAGFTQKVFSIKYHTLEKGGVSKVVTINRACKGMYVVYNPKVHGTQEQLKKQGKKKAQTNGQPTPTSQGAGRDQIKIWDLDYQNKFGRKTGWHTIYYDQIRAVNDRLVLRPITQGE